MQGRRNPRASNISVPVTLHTLVSPVGLLVSFAGIALLGSVALPDAAFQTLFSQPVFLNADLRMVSVAYFLLLLLVAAIGAPRSTHSNASIVLTPNDQRWLDRAVRALSSAAFAAYAAWLIVALSRGFTWGILVQLLGGDASASFTLRDDYFGAVSGLTTWVQVGVVAAPLAVLRARAGIRRALPVLVPLFAAAALRALVNSERLGLVEVAISTCLAYLLLRSETPRLLARRSSLVGTVAAAWAGLFVFFAAFEYLRSWQSVKGTGTQSFWAYSYNLLLGYYATALNNSGFDHYILQGHSNYRVILEGNLYRNLLGPSPLEGAQEAYGLEVFTNRSGLLTPYNAFGLIGGATVIALTGLIIAAAARSASRGSAVAFAMYCSLAVALLEIVRIYYLGASRVLPIAIAGAYLWVGHLLAQPVTSRHRASRSGPIGHPPGVEAD